MDDILKDGDDLEYVDMSLMDSLVNRPASVPLSTTFIPQVDSESVSTFGTSPFKTPEGKYLRGFIPPKQHTDEATVMSEMTLDSRVLKIENKFDNIVTPRGLLKRLDETKASNRANTRFRGVPKGRGSKVYGVWERKGYKGREGLNLLVAFTPFIRHRKFIDFFKLSHKVVKNNMFKEINKQMIKRINRRFS